MKVVRKKEQHPESILPIALDSTAVIELQVNRKPIESVTGEEVCLMPVDEMESSSQIGFAFADVWLRQSSGVAAIVSEFGITSSTTRYLPVSQYD